MIRTNGISKHIVMLLADSLPYLAQFLVREQLLQLRVTKEASRDSFRIILEYQMVIEKRTMPVSQISASYQQINYLQSYRFFPNSYAF